jgi:hypothetical protein
MPLQLWVAVALFWVGLAGDLAERVVRVLEGEPIARQMLVALAPSGMPVAPPVLMELVRLAMSMVPLVSLEPNPLPEDLMKNCGHESKHWQAALYGGQ